MTDRLDPPRFHPPGDELTDDRAPVTVDEPDDDWLADRLDPSDEPDALLDDYGAGDEEGGAATIARAHEVGVTLFDTAELYGAGTGSNEQLVGRAVAGFRDEIVIATKFGFTAPDFGFDSRPDHIREVVDASLLRLGVDHIDYQISPAVER